MAVLGSILFKRTLKQFLDCDDLGSAKALALIEKLRGSSKDSLEQLIQLIPETSGSHQEKLIEICVEHVGGSTEDLFLRNLDNDATEIRSAAASILSKTTRASASKLFQKLHEPTAQKSEIINILASQREQLKPEQLIANALKLDQTHAEQLFKLAPDSKFPLNMEVLRVEPVAIGSPAVKIMLLRYFAQLDQDGIGGEIAKFLPEANKTVVLEALKALRNLKGKFDALTLMPYIESMSEDERSLAIEVLKNQANAEMVPRLAPWSCGKSDELREILVQLFIKYATPKGLETFLVLLEQQEWWGADKSLKCLHKLGTQQFFSMAEGLTNHGKEFVREQAQKLATKALGPADLEGLWAKAKAGKLAGARKCNRGARSFG